MSALGLTTAVILVMALLEAPLFSVLAGLAMACTYLTDFDLLAIQAVLIEMNRLATMPVLAALPLFTATGVLLTRTGAPKRLLAFLQAALGGLPGGVAMAAVALCALFTALTGASGVTILALGGILYPLLRRKPADERFALGLLTASGSIGLLFPPSLPVILYGVVARIDIAKIFKAALIPAGLLIGALFVAAWVRDIRFSRKDDLRVSTTGQWRQTAQAFWAARWEWPIILIILVGIYGGLSTVVEISAVVFVYVLIVAGVICREIDLWRDLPAVLIESAMLSGAIIVILGFALGFTGYLVDAQIPEKILAALSTRIENRYLFLAALNIFLLLVGCLVDIFSAIVIVVPLIVPIATQFGVDPIHLAIIFLVNLEIGYITPPIGMNLFIASLKFERPVTVLYRAALPYLLILAAVLVAITYLPILSLGLIK